MVEVTSGELSRRALLTSGLAAVGSAALWGISGCGSDDAAPTVSRTPGGAAAPAGSNPASGAPSASPSSTPAHRGGQLRLVGAGSATLNLNPLTSADNVSFLAFWQIYDQLVRMEGDTLVNSLAEEIEPDAKATTWTIRVRDGATFHNGKPVTAQDVAYSLRSYGDPERSPNYSALYSDIDLTALKVQDARTLRVPLKRARGDFRDVTLSQMSLVFPDGTTDADWNTGIGSGPFSLTSVDSGGIVLAANPNYWNGAPLLDGAAITVVADAQARLNAVRSGQADYALDIPASSVRAVANSTDVAIQRGGAANSVARSFEMNSTKDPFTDATVRQALKLLVDRQQLVDTVLLGSGQVGNDVYGLGLSGYDSSLPKRERDVDKAKSLLAAAGVSQLTLRAAELVSGTVDSATLLAQQAKEAGLTITIEKAAADTYFNDYAGVLATPMQAFYFINRPAATMISGYTGSAATFNVTGVGGEQYDAMLTSAQATVDDDARAARFDELQHHLWENGGDVVWGFAEQLDAVTPGVQGTVLCQSVPLLETASLPA